MFGNCLRTELLRDHDGGAHDGKVIRRARHIAHETTVDLDHISGNLFKTLERLEADTEIVDADMTATFTQLLEQTQRFGLIGNRRRFGDLEAQAVGRQYEAVQLCEQLPRKAA